MGAREEGEAGGVGSVGGVLGRSWFGEGRDKGVLWGAVHAGEAHEAEAEGGDGRAGEAEAAGGDGGCHFGAGWAVGW